MWYRALNRTLDRYYTTLWRSRRTADYRRKRSGLGKKRVAFPLIVQKWMCLSRMFQRQEPNVDHPLALVQRLALAGGYTREVDGMR